MLTVGLLAVSGCMSTHLVQDKVQKHVEYSESDGQTREVEGEPGYYALLPLTIVGDVATSPFQLFYVLFTNDSRTASANIHGVPVPLP